VVTFLLEKATTDLRSGKVTKIKPGNRAKGQAGLIRLPPSEHMGPLGKLLDSHVGGQKAIGTEESPGVTLATFTRESGGVRAPLNAK
jgi:hypothetical protein